MNDKSVVRQANRDHLLFAMGIEQWFARAPITGAPIDHRIIPLTKRSAKSDLSSHSLTGDTYHDTSHHPIDSRHHSGTPQSGSNIGQEKVIVSRGLALAEVLDLDSASGSGSKGVSRSREPVPRPSAIDDSSTRQKRGSTGNSLTKKSSNGDLLNSFELLWTASDGVLLVDDVSDASFASSAYLHWVNSIFVACGSASLPPHAQLQQRFRWPLENAQLFDDNLGESGLAVAKETVSAWLMRALKQQKISKVVVMGPAAIAMLSNVDQISEALGRAAMLPELNGVVAVLTHGSQQLWKEAELKAALWTHLQLLNTEVSENS